MSTTSRRPRLAFVGPRPDAPGGIAQFGANLVRSVQHDADVQVTGFRRLYPTWTKPGRLAPDVSASGVGIATSAVLVPWRPWTWRSAVRELRSFRPDAVVVQWWHPMLGPCLRSVARGARRGGAR